MISGAETKPFSPPSTFPRFPDLALELRIQIWQHALHSASNRVIPVAINHHPVQTIHSCVPLLKTFCGQHTHCPLHTSNPSQPSSSLVSMFNGYFSLPPNTPDIEDAAVRNLSRVCTESYRAFVWQYPETMTVYRETWYPDAKSHQRRQVRCNPATDTLLVKAVPSYPSGQRHPSPSLDNPEDLYQQDLKKWFPQNPDTFASFRTIISSFRHVVFGFLDDLETPRSLFFSGALDDPQFRQFLIFFEHLEHLSLCSDSEHLTAVREWGRVERVEDRRREGSMDEMGLQSFVGVSSGILNCDYKYNEYVRGQSELSAESGGCCWVPMPRGFGGSWLFCSRDVIGSGEDGNGG
ncbi:hypothetical protein V500_05384 [Pseudogymnoascus sp. VKM F-4518 (FW-2643)]|nr:hypothetical protein V500_05384 [Pseudogymnoascus sp. VKM F-4518 (FW-2643)]